METLCLKPKKYAIKFFKKIIQEGEIAAFPTETVYGLGADATNSSAVKKIFLVKGRPSDNPLIVNLSNKKDIKKYAQKVSCLENKIIKYFMPGPISLVLTKNDLISNLVSAGGETIAFRIPQNKLARKLIKATKRPICAPSANTSKRPSPTTANHVLSDLSEKIPLIIDGGQTDVGIESTVVKVIGEDVYILRPGKILKQNLETKLKCKVYEKSFSKNLESPGVKYAHYMPKCEMFLLDEENIEAVKNFYITQRKSGKKVVIFCNDSQLKLLKDYNTFSLGKDSNEASHNLFKALRDYENNDVIIALKIKNGTMVEGLYNRMFKACGGKIIK